MCSLQAARIASLGALLGSLWPIPAQAEMIRFELDVRVDTVEDAFRILPEWQPGDQVTWRLDVDTRDVEIARLDFGLFELTTHRARGGRIELEGLPPLAPPVVSWSQATSGTPRGRYGAFSVVSAPTPLVPQDAAFVLPLAGEEMVQFRLAEPQDATVDPSPLAGALDVGDFSANEFTYIARRSFVWIEDPNFDRWRLCERDAAESGEQPCGPAPLVPEFTTSGYTGAVTAMRQIEVHEPGAPRMLLSIGLAFALRPPRLMLWENQSETPEKVEFRRLWQAAVGYARGYKGPMP